MMRSERDIDGGRPGQRGQLVLIAAVALAVALAGITVAYLQLGYHEDIGASTGDEPAHQIVSTLDRSVHDVANVTTTYDWDERTAAVTTVKDRLDPTLETVRTAGLDDGHVYEVSYNGTHATQWSQQHCPEGPDRQFGPCEADGGIVIQERDGKTHVLGVGVDVQITTPDGETTVTTVIVHRAT